MGTGRLQFRNEKTKVFFFTLDACKPALGDS